jgi:multicomponent Na+:H+ antiporter subunit D
MSGFVAKIGLVAAGLEAEEFALVGAALVASALTLFVVARAWSDAFWKVPPEGLSIAVEGRVSDAGTRVGMMVPVAVLTALLVVLGVAAEPLVSLSLEAGEQLVDRSGYVEAVLGGGQ